MVGTPSANNLNDVKQDTIQWDAKAHRVTIVDSSGNTGNIISGIDYVSGNNGIDPSTNSLQYIAYPHHEIHEGNHYYVQGFIELNNTAEFFIKLVTPDTTKWIHFVFSIKSTGICTTYLDEDATGGMTGGTAMVPINNNRNSANTSGVVLTSNVTDATSYTTRLESDKWGSNGFKETIGGGGGREDELILKQNTTYLRTFISGADSNIIQFKASWYEHTEID